MKLLLSLENAYLKTEDKIYEVWRDADGMENDIAFKDYRFVGNNQIYDEMFSRTTILQEHGVKSVGDFIHKVPLLTEFSLKAYENGDVDFRIVLTDMDGNLASITPIKTDAEEKQSAINFLNSAIPEIVNYELYGDSYLHYELQRISNYLHQRDADNRLFSGLEAKECLAVNFEEGKTVCTKVKFDENRYAVELIGKRTNMATGMDCNSLEELKEKLVQEHDFVIPYLQMTENEEGGTVDLYFTVENELQATPWLEKEKYKANLRPEEGEMLKKHSEKALNMTINEYINKIYQEEQERKLQYASAEPVKKNPVKSFVNKLFGKKKVLERDC